MPVKVRRGQIVEHQAAIVQVALGQRLLYDRLTRLQRIHGRIEIIFIHRFPETKRLGELLQPPGLVAQSLCRRQFGLGIEDACCNQGESALTDLALQAENLGNLQSSDRSQDSGDMAIGHRPGDFQR